MSINELQYETNTAKAILAAAALFKHPHQVIWEYVTNEIQYREKSIRPKIYVTLEKDKIVISGNGSGMDTQDLKNFFKLHGENIERKKGNPGRGKHGTGKSAAYGIANSLVISTVKNKKKFVIKLTKKEISKYKSSGKPIPLKDYVIEEGSKSKEPNGTLIEITELQTKVDKKEIINYIEKHITYFKGAEVWVDRHLCEPKEPTAKKIFKFNSSKDYPELGNIDLIIKIASEPLEKIDQGVSILSNQNLHEITLCGAEGKEMSNYIFGEIDCPKIDDDDQEIPALSMARDMTLNKHNSTVKSIYSFIGFHIEDIRKQLVKENNELRESEEAKKLQKQADKIAEKINEHFENYKDKIKMKHRRLSDGKTGIAISMDSGKSDIDGSLTVGEEIKLELLS